MDRRHFLLGAGAAAAAGMGGAAYARFVEPGWVEFTVEPLPPPSQTPPSPTPPSPTPPSPTPPSQTPPSPTPPSPTPPSPTPDASTPRSPKPPPPADRPPAGLPSIAHISDLHLRDLTDLHHDIAGELARRRPDVVVITGDSVDDPRFVPLLADFLALLPATTPKLAILGNWEHWGGVDPAALERVYGRAGCELLVNRSVRREVAGTRLRISGVDDLVGGRPDLHPLIRSDRDADLHLLLAHCPAHRDRIPPAADFDLVLSGHTHGGQVQLFGQASFVPRGSGRYLEGWYTDDGPPMYVSRGVGTSVLPVRFGARPEVTFFRAA